MRARSGLVLSDWLLDVATQRFAKHSCVHFARKGPSRDMSSTYFLFLIQLGYFGRFDGGGGILILRGSSPPFLTSA